MIAGWKTEQTFKISIRWLKLSPYKLLKTNIKCLLDHWQFIWKDLWAMPVCHELIENEFSFIYLNSLTELLSSSTNSWCLFPFLVSTRMMWGLSATFSLQQVSFGTLPKDMKKIELLIFPLRWNWRRKHSVVC